MLRAAQLNLKIYVACVGRKLAWADPIRSVLPGVNHMLSRLGV